eukprot:4723515-Pyramimonas_sp.AAC.1
MIHASSKCGSVCLQTVMLVVPDDSSAYDVLHDPHLVDWPIPDFAEDTPLVNSGRKEGMTSPGARPI